MSEHDPKVILERERAFRTERHLKRAVKIATKFKEDYENSHKENESLKKELAELKRVKTGKNNINGIKIASLIGSLDPENRKSFRNLLRKSLHSDKHRGLNKDLKDALDVLLIIIERYFE